MNSTLMTSLVFTSFLLLLLCSVGLIEGSQSPSSRISRQQFDDDDLDPPVPHQQPSSALITYSNIFLFIMIALLASLLAGYTRLAIVFTTFAIGIWLLLGQQNHDNDVRARMVQYVAIDHGRIN